MRGGRRQTRRMQALLQALLKALLRGFKEMGAVGLRAVQPMAVQSSVEARLAR